MLGFNQASMGKRPVSLFLILGAFFALEAAFPYTGVSLQKLLHLHIRYTNGPLSILNPKFRCGTFLHNLICRGRSICGAVVRANLYDDCFRVMSSAFIFLRRLLSRMIVGFIILVC